MFFHPSAASVGGLVGWHWQSSEKCVFAHNDILVVLVALWKQKCREDGTASKSAGEEGAILIRQYKEGGNSETETINWG